jgi:hypothetical protein
MRARGRGRCMEGALGEKAWTLGSGARWKAAARLFGAVMAVALICPFASSPARALEPAPGERAALDACRRQLCETVRKRAEKGKDYSCRLSRTWTRDAIAEGAKKSMMNWALGDARCTVSVDLPRTELAKALGEPRHKIEAAEHRIECVIERDGKLEPVTAVIAPRLEFKDGQARKAWIGLKSIDAPSEIKALVRSMVQLHDKVGLFHSGTIKAVNKLVHRTCAGKDR